jgi:hypothetical protein
MQKLQKGTKKTPRRGGEARCRGGSGLLWGCGAAVVQPWCGSGVNALKLLLFDFLAWKMAV